MQIQSITTPFGRRSMTLAMLASQRRAEQVAPDQSVDKWVLFRAACAAKDALGVTDRELAVLNALLSFLPAASLRAGEAQIVFPSNEQLCSRAHGMAETTLRRHIAALVHAGLLIRRDSPNGKRYARRDGEGEIAQAYGFDLSPLLARADEIQYLAAEIKARQIELRIARERLTLCRRDVAKLIEAAIGEGAAGDWTATHERFRTIIGRIPRKATTEALAPLLAEMDALRAEVLERLETLAKSRNMDGNDGHNGRHIQNSNPDSIIDFEPVFEKSRGKTAQPARTVAAETRETKSYPLGMVLKACPEISMYGPGGAVTSWRDLMTAAVVVRSMLGVSPSAYETACAVMGQENAATVMACILERSRDILSPGGYIRDLTQRAERGEFSTGPMLMALLRTNGEPATRMA